LAVKHPGPGPNTGIRYVVPSIALMALLNIQVVGSLKHLASYYYKFVFYVVILFGVISGVYSLNSWAITSSKYYNDEMSLLSRINNMDGCSVIQNYRASSIEFALGFGNGFSGSSYSEELEKMYPKAVFYNMATGIFSNYNKEYNSSDVLKLFVENRCLLIYGIPLEDRDINALHLKPISVTSQVALYKISEDLFRTTR
jgi:hypothetical protein